jgi:ATP-dependent RNA helicase DeaD
VSYRQKSTKKVLFLIGIVLYNGASMKPQAIHMHSFKDLGLNEQIRLSLTELGYESPSPIQDQSILPLIEGRDILAQAQTGTGKTAAFALPILQRLNIKKKVPQALILAPTRELAIQVAESFQSYAKHIEGFHVLPIYGGQDYRVQLNALKRGVHVVVGTPGRVMDHLRRETLPMHQLKTLVLDEADEMLKMGFIDDVGWILEQIPHDHQTALFSATIPPSIRNIVERYLKDPVKLHIQPKVTSAASIRQCYMTVGKNQKIEALSRFLEVENANAALVFTRTKVATAEVAEKLKARGYNAEALNGDMSQSLREKVIQRVKKGQLDIVVATDVAARGIDVERIGHVINYDAPYDTESYIHRIGRTGRAGREGTALLLITPREKRMLKDIERAVRKPLEMLDPPSVREINSKRSEDFSSKIGDILDKTSLEKYHGIIEKVMHDTEHSALDVAAAIVHLMQRKKPMFLKPEDNLKAPKDEAPAGRKAGRSTGRRRSPPKHRKGNSSNGNGNGNGYKGKDKGKDKGRSRKDG